MNLDTKHPVPLYRKLLFENKILLLFTLLLLVLGSVFLLAQFWATGRVVKGMMLDRLEADLAPFLEPMGESAREADVRRLYALLEQASNRDDKIAYLSVTDSEGRVLACHATSPMVSLPPDEGARAESAGRFKIGPKQGAAMVWTFPLTSGNNEVGTLQAGVEKRQLRLLAVKIVTSVFAVMVLPVLAVLIAARTVVRRAIEPLKRLTEVADDISTGNLDQQIDFGVHVNCWEIKNCQRTDCKAFMNLSRQCWYIDDTPCEGYEPRFPQKLEGCRSCEVYQAHRGDEIVQLADAFKHMTHVLKESREELLKSDDFQKRLIRNSFDGIVAADARDTITIFNRVAEDLTGYDREELIGVRDWRVLFEDRLEKSMDMPLSYGRFRRLRGSRRGSPRS